MTDMDKYEIEQTVCSRANCNKTIINFVNTQYGKICCKERFRELCDDILGANETDFDR